MRYIRHFALDKKFKEALKKLSNQDKYYFNAIF